MINISNDPEPGIIGELQKLAVKMSLWAFLPVVLNLTAFWYLKSHDPVRATLVVLVSILGTFVVFWFWLKYESNDWKSKPIAWKATSIFSFSLVFLVGILLLFFIFDWTSEGGKDRWLKHKFLRPILCVDLSYQKLIVEPRHHYKGLFWGDLKKARLEGGNLVNSVLKRANLANARLQHAKMHRCVLEEANLKGADLTKARLPRANLIKANFEDAILRSVNLQDANLSKAVLNGADLEGAYMEETNLRDAELLNAKLKKANLRGADLRGVRLRRARDLQVVKTLYEAVLDPKLSELIKENWPYLLKEPKEE
jgi:hypothetical protein